MNGTLRRAVLSALFGIVALMGCSTTGTTASGHLQPRSLDDVRSTPAVLVASGPGQPKLALVLGGGGTRGFAHVGVLRALEEAGVEPDIVVGTSAGAVVGAAYASGLNSSQIDQAKQDLSLSSLFDWTFTRGGLIRGDRLAKWVDGVTRGQAIESFPRRFAAVATDQ